MKNYYLPEEKFNELEERILKLNKKYNSSISTKIIQKTLSKGINGVEFTLIERDSLWSWHIRSLERILGF